MVSFSYRRPAYVPAAAGADISTEEKEKFLNDSRGSGRSGRSDGIPEELSLDNIVSNNVCPPCTARDFLNYLKYIEHAAENLQFYMWYRDYLKRFEELPEAEKKLSPRWPFEPSKDGLKTKAYDGLEIPSSRKKKISDEIAVIFKGTDFEDVTPISVGNESANPFDSPFENPFDTPPETPQTPASGMTRVDSLFGTGSYSSFDAPSDADAHVAMSGNAFKSAGQKWQPFTIQPFREEISRIIALYVADGAPRQLNLSTRERKTVLRSLTQTTHPSALKCIVTNIEWSLRCQAHPNFIRWTICNGNRPRVIFARGLGLFGIAAGLASGVLITLSSAGRAWRVMALIGLVIGISTLIAAWKGMCVVLHGMHHRHLRPWELFTDEHYDEEDMMRIEKQEKRGSVQSKNSYENEPWVIKYEKRNLIRKIFDREVWIEEPALRQIQDVIFFQSLLAAFIISGIIVAVFCAMPKGRMY